MQFKMCAATLAALGVMSGAMPAAAQIASTEATYLTDSASPFTTTMAEAGEPVPMPKLSFTSDGTEAADFDKYYAFHRDGADYPTAFADLVECDGYARGLASGINYQEPVYPYAGTMAGAVGGALANAMVAAIFGSAEKRRLRRVNMRTCMNFKGYDRFGLPKSVWDEFNFEEGLGNVNQEKRLGYLRQQAMVASAGKLQGKALGL
jgi:hypothetical protein